jgi:hypothetical protein
MRSLETLRDSCIDGTSLQTAWNGNITLVTAGVGNSILMQKTITANGFYYFYVNLTYAIASGSWVDGSDYFKCDVYTSDTSENPATVYNPLINAHYEQKGNGGSSTVFTGTIVLYCNAGHTYGLYAVGSKKGSANVHLFETMRIF